MSTPDFARHRERHIIMAREVIRNEARALEETAEAIGTDFADAVELMAACTGQIVVCGVGKSGHVAAKIASTLSSTGTPASFLDAADAVHGDLGGLRKGDIVLAISHSGENPELLAVLPLFKHFDVQVIAITDNIKSTLSLVSNIALFPGKTSGADPIGLAPTASSAAALAIGDGLALAIAQHRGYTVADFEHHPGGAIGKLMESVYGRKRPAE
ncbi:MAG: SIS domain-containing protein [Chloroflexota bacterium]